MPRPCPPPLSSLALLAALSLTTGCRTAARRPPPVAVTPVAVAPPFALAPSSSGARGDAHDAGPSARVAFVAPATLDGEELVDRVVGKIPSVEAMTAAWRTASEKYPQVVSLDDPVLTSMSTPTALDSAAAPPGHAVGSSQKLPWFGKRAARGRVARAEATAAQQKVQSTRLEVAETARLAYYDYYLARRLLELNRENRLRMEQFRDTARQRYASNLASRQDVLQSEVSLGDVARRRSELERMDRVAMARIDTLLLLPPDVPLPPPPAMLEPVGLLPPADELRSLALNYRPDLAAMGARIQVEEASAALAAKEFYPEAEASGRYDSIRQPAASAGPSREQTGGNTNAPLNRRKRQAAVNEALFRAGQRRAEYQQRLNDIQYEVQTDYEQLEQARQTVSLYHERFLPAAENNVRAAEADYIAGRSGFLELTQAQQQLTSLREKREEALADCHRRRAELERTLGCPLPKATPAPPEPLATQPAPPMQPELAVRPAGA